MRSQFVKERSSRRLRNHETDQEAAALGQGTAIEIVRGTVTAEAEKGMCAIGREAIIVTAEAQAKVQALTIKAAVEQGMMISTEARAGAGVEVAPTIVLALARAQHHATGDQDHAAGA